MKKKSLFAAGALLLTAAFGFTAMAVSGIINPFAAVTTAIGDSTIKEASTFPTDKGYSGGPNTLTQAYFTYELESGQKIELIPSDTEKVVITPAEGEPLELSLAEGSSCLKVVDNTLYVDFGKALGVGTYTIKVPAGVMHVDDAINTAIEYSFTVKVVYLTLRTSSPANNEVVPSFPAVTECFFAFNIAGDDPMTLAYPEGAVVNVTKDGAEFASYPVVKDSKNVYTTRQWADRVYISFGQALEPGEYTVTLPQGVCQGPAPSGDMSVGSGNATSNAELTLKFTVKKAFEYTVSPALNTTVSRSQMQNVVLTYPENATVKVNNPSLRPLLTLKDESGAVKADTIYYNVTANGNKLELTADLSDGKKIPTDSRAINMVYFHMEIAKGLFSVTDGAETLSNSAMDLGKWQILPLTVADYKFEPALDTPGLTINDLEEVTLILPEGCSWTNQKELVEGYKAALFSLYPLPVSNTFSFSYMFKSVSEDGRRITCYRAPQSSATSAAGNTSLVQDGPTILRFAKGKITIQDGDATSTSAAMDIPAWDLTGRTDLPIYNSTPANGGVPTTKENGVVVFNSLTVNVLRNATVAPGAEKKKIIVRDVAANNMVVSSVLVGETTTKNALVGGSGATSIAYSKLFKTEVYDEDGNSTLESISDPSVYEVSIPAGAYAQKDKPEWVSPAYKLLFYIPKDFEHTYSPAPADFSGATVVPAEPMTEFSEIVLTYPGANEIELTNNYKNVLQNCGIGVATYANAQKNSQTASASNTYGYSFKDIELIGKNQVKLTLNTPWIHGIPSDRALIVKIYQGLFYVIKYNDNGSKEYCPNPTLNVYYQPINVHQGVLEYPQEGKQDFYKDQLATINYTGTMTVAYSTTTPNLAYLVNAAGEKVLVYKGKKPTDRPGVETLFVAEQSVQPEGVIVADVIDNLPYGEYKFVIEKGDMLFGGTSASSAVYNQEEWSYPVNLVKTPLPPAGNLADLLHRYMPATEEFTTADSPFGMGTLVIRLEGPAGFKLDPECKEPYQLKYEGEVMASFTNAAPAGVVELQAEAGGDVPSPLAEGEEPTEPTEPANKSAMLALYLNSLPDIGPMLEMAYGAWEVVVPDGAILSEAGNPYIGASVAYNFTKPQVDFTYELSPANEEVCTGKIAEISLTFPNAQSVDYMDTGAATMTNPDGVLTNVPTPNFNATGNGVVFSLTNAKLYPDTYWVSGEYTFVVNADKICLNSLVDDTDPSWFEGLTAKFYLQNGVGVTMIAADADGLYQVYAADGKVVRLNATAADLDALEPGLYIVNGQKLLIRK